MPGLHRFLIVALSLLVAIGATRAIEEVDRSQVLASGEEGAREAAGSAIAHVERRFQQAEMELLSRAERIASKPAVREALISRDERLAIEALRSETLPRHIATEIFTPLPEVIAWRGPSLPLDPATRRLAFLDTAQSSIVHDGMSRAALAVWYPIREENRILGAVRVVRLLRVDVPVRNQYLQDLDVVEEWSRARTPLVEVALAGEAPTDAGEGIRHTINSVDGFPLATVSASLPPIETLADSRRPAYRDAAAFFATLLLFWLLFGLTVVGARATIAVYSRPGGGRMLAGVAIGATVIGAALGVRYALLALGVPIRFAGVSPPPAFDPAYLGSGIGRGIASSAVEMAITALFVVMSGGWMLFVGLRAAGNRLRRDRVRGDTAAAPLWDPAAATVGAVSIGLVLGAVGLIHRATADATIGYFDRTGPLPEALVLLAFGSFLLVLFGVMLLAIGLLLCLGIRRLHRATALIVAVVVVGVMVAIAVLPTPAIVSVVAMLIVIVASTTIERNPHRWAAAIGLRGAVVLSVVLSILTYPIVSEALTDRDEARLMDHVADFVDGEDPRVAFALESVLIDARASEAVRQTLSRVAGGRPTDTLVADSLAADLVTGSLLAALADYQVGLSLHAPDGTPVGKFTDEPRAGVGGGAPVARTQGEAAAFARLHRLYEEEAVFAGFAVERRPAIGRGSKYRFAGIGPVRVDGDDEPPIGWIVARAEPRPSRYVAETPFPRVLVPAGLQQASDDEWVFAEFQGGVLHRSRGADFGRLRLPPTVQELAVGESAWRNERVEGQAVRVYYERVDDDRVIAVRVPAATIFDHLFSLLRILSAGFFLALLAFLVGVVVRRATALRPARPRLRDRVLNRFLLVGLLAIGATGLIGREVIAIQNREAVEERLKRQITRVEALLYEEAGGAEAEIPPERILDRARLDLVGQRLGLDVNLYRGAELVASSRSQLVRQRLIEPRLPIEVVEALFVNGERYAFASERIGDFRFTTGYEAIPGPDGRPAVVLGVPTLPEQLAIEADQARMTAYLFGVLLLLLLVIFVIATVLANRLTRPFVRLRAGLRAVGAGEAPSEPIPVESRDEVGEVIETFNAVWDQLEESRRRLAAQERDLAWREMARQVAHEIKNPLTPMRLSVQHLRRAYERAGEEAPPNARFAELLDQISGTLIEQIDALNRIASEFSRLGQLPDRLFEVFELNEVLSQAAALVSEEPRAEIMLDLSPEPLMVRADREELRRVYINLLKNAQQAIPEGEHGLITVVSAGRVGIGGPDNANAWAETRVIDTGVGIPEEVQKRVFQPNFSTKTSGMGLGLAIARKTVVDLGGDIRFETVTGVGTTFIIRLPLVTEFSAMRDGER